MSFFFGLIIGRIRNRSFLLGLAKTSRVIAQLLVGSAVALTIVVLMRDDGWRHYWDGLTSGNPDSTEKTISNLAGAIGAASSIVIAIIAGSIELSARRRLDDLDADDAKKAVVEPASD